MLVYVCSCDMLAELLESSDLFMMQVEMDAYTLTKKVCMYICMYVHTYVCMYMYVCTHIIMLAASIMLYFYSVVVSKTTPTMGW